MKRIAFAMAVLFLAPLSALAGTTGGLSGAALTWEGAPIANALVRVTSGTQVATTRTDLHGNFAFVSLTPDVYEVAIEREGFEPWRAEGVPVFADSTVHVSARLSSTLTKIVHVLHEDIGTLVKPRVTSDVYAYGRTKFLIAPPVLADYWTLRMTPGITFAPGNSAPSSPL